MAAKYTIRLPRLPVNWRDQPELFERYWDEAMSRLETTLNAILQIPELQAAIDEAKAAAKNANDAADSVKAEADTQAKESSIVTSYVSGADPVVTASALGSVTVSNHNRVYGNSSINPTVSVTGGVIPTTATPGQTVRIYYSDPTRSGGSVTYQYTIDPAPPPVQGGDIHSVGAVVIPDTGESDGDFVRPPGYVNPNKFINQD